jgi:hypothetical protein
MMVHTGPSFSILTVMVALLLLIVIYISVKNSTVLNKPPGVLTKFDGKRTENRRQKAVSELKRSLIMDAARQVFEAEGWRALHCGRSRRLPAGSPPALYFHFESKEAIYAEVRQSLADLERAVAAPSLAPKHQRPAPGSWHGILRYYADNPETSISASIFSRRMKPHGLGETR